MKFAEYWARERHEAADARYSVCDFIGELGRRAADPLIDRIVALRDEKTRAFSDAELA